MTKARPPLDRFTEKVDFVGPLPTWAPFLGPCWLWTRGLDQGYGQFFVERSRTWHAHRWLWLQVVGPIPGKLQLDHLCRVRRCVNPDHLEVVTCKVNVHRSQSLQAKNAVKTHCPQGHPYDEANTRLYQGRRYCRACKGASENRRRRRKRSSG